MNILEQKTTESTVVLVCKICDYKCSDSSNFKKHNNTKKHKTRVCEQNVNPTDTKNTEIVHSCKNCNKVYKNRNGLWYHKQKCVKEPVDIYIKNINILISENKDFKNIILDLVKSNTDLQKQMTDVCKNAQINNSTINSHNKTFNLQVFLNEKCKDAMNLVDFVNSMTLELSDLEEVGTLGYVEGISNIIIRKLNALDVYKRPIHCSDGKREIVYVKEDDVWEKENNTYDKLRRVIKQVTYKNSSLLVPWSEKYPNCMNNQHSLNDVYVRMMGQAMGGREAFVDSENKIMKKIAKAVLIEKM
jgi:hypothetical protein